MKQLSPGDWKERAATRDCYAINSLNLKASSVIALLLKNT
jgi:hypothetical protein